MRSSAYYNRLLGSVTGTTRKRISRKNLGNVELDVPSLSEQKSVVEKLNCLVNIMCARQQELQKLDDLIKARFIEMFGDCKTNPKAWKIKHLEDVAEVGSSKRVFVEELKEAGIPFYRGTEVGALAEGKLAEPELFITEEHYKSLCEASGTPQIGDLLMPSICPDGRIWVVNTATPFYFKDGRVLWVHDIDSSYNPIFLLYTLKDRIMTDYSSIASGTTFAELKIFALKRCQIFETPKKLQNQFADFVAQVDKSKVVVQKALDKTQLLFDSLMQEYFG
jgi:type I restriction enzyme S subunit